MWRQERKPVQLWSRGILSCPGLLGNKEESKKDTEGPSKETVPRRYMRLNLHVWISLLLTKGNRLGWGAEGHVGTGPWFCGSSRLPAGQHSGVLGREKADPLLKGRWSWSSYLSVPWLVCLLLEFLTLVWRYPVWSMSGQDSLISSIVFTFNFI